MEDQRRPSRAAGYPASADTECGGAVAAARQAERRLGLRENPTCTERNSASADGGDRRASAAGNVEFGRSAGHSASADMEGRRALAAVKRNGFGFSLGRKAGGSGCPAPAEGRRPVAAASHPVPAGHIGRKPGGFPRYPAPGAKEGRRAFAAGDEKFGRSAGHSATADMEGRRSFAAVERDRFGFSLYRKPGGSAGYPAPANMEGRRPFAAVERD
ncbi:hypothetical protein HRG_013286 [Hirsutella rhossiliensis]